MHIKELEVDNFKSFANNIKIPFLKGFTVVAGPNGSGKSNIIDAVLFALGLANPRNLRTEQASDFISNYTKKDETFVRVVLEPDNDSEEELTVARKLKKSTQGYNSTYYLNDKVSTKFDILSKLEKYSITPHSYNVVMQNDVMNIVNCSNVDRREIVDEIAGIGDFNRRIEKAQEELQTVENRVENTNWKLTEIAASVDRLEQEKETALKYQKLRTEKNQLEGQITTVKYFDVKRNLELAHQNILEFNKKKKEEEGKLKQLEDTLSEIEKRYDEIQELVKNNGEAEQIETKKKLEELKAQITGKNNAISFAEKNIHGNLRTIENTKNGIDKCNEKIQDAEEQIKNKKNEIAETEELIKVQETELKKKLEEVSGLNQNADKQLEERNNLKTELENLKEEEYTIRSESIPLETELATTKKDVENAKKSLKELTDFKTNYKNNKDKLSIQVEELTKELSDYKLANDNVIYNLDKNKNELSDLIYDIQAAQKKILTIEAQKNAYEEMNLGRAVDAILKAKIRGVHAPLLQLGSVDKEYSIALEIAMGGRMKNIVVDDEDVARTCVDYLKSARAGRATFLPLNKMKKAPSKLSLPKEKGVIDYAINLIDFDDKYLDTFFYALGETLIVEDFDCAKKLIGKYRLVTLDGSLFEKSGAITGGDKQDTGLKFSQNQDEELRKYKERFAELQRKQQSLENTKKELEIKQDKIKQDYLDTTTALKSATLELKNLNDNSQNIEQKIEEYNKTIKENEPIIQSLEKKLEKYEEKCIALNDKMLVLQEKITEIESKMSEGELKKLKEMTAAIEDQIQKYKDKVQKCNTLINGFNNDIAFQENVRTAHEQTIQKLLKDNEEYEADKIKYAEEIKGIEEKTKVLEEELETLGEKLKELQQQRDLVQKELLEAKDNKNKITNEIERIAEQVESFKTRRKELEPQLEEVTLELKNNEIDINSLVPTEISTEEITAKIQRLQKRMEEMEPVNMLAIQDYDRAKARYDELKAQIETLTNERKEILEKMSGFEQQKKENFMTTYNNLDKNFKEVFSLLSEGEGSLVLENPESPFEGGLTIKAQIRDKNQQKLISMSGGEKSLTALAFVFAIQKYMPAPFYALDEVDANLDELNRDRVSKIIKEQSKNTQFIVVAHTQNMIKYADRTIGVTQKDKGKSLVTGIKN